MKVSVIVPCYYSESTVGELTERIVRTVEELDGWEPEIILVNDYSGDGTMDVIRSLAARFPCVTGIDLARNFGQHGALLCGMRYATGDVVCGIDDDLQIYPEDIPLLLEKLEEGWDAVFGKYKSRSFGKKKNFFGRVSQALLFRLVDRPKDVEMSSFFAIRRYVAEELVRYRGNDPFVQLLIARTTRRITNVPVDHHSRTAGESHYTFRKGLRLFLSFMSFSTIPLQAATLFGILFSAVGFLGAVIVFIRKLVHPSIAVGWSSLMCILLFVGGILCLMIGIVGDYVGKTLMAVNNTPLYVAREIVGRGEEEP